LVWGRFLAIWVSPGYGSSRTGGSLAASASDAGKLWTDGGRGPRRPGGAGAPVRGGPVHAGSEPSAGAPVNGAPGAVTGAGARGCERGARTGVRGAWVVRRLRMTGDGRCVGG